MEKNQWVPIRKGAKEDTPSVKKVKKSGLKTLKGVSVDTTRRGSTRITYELGGVWKGSFEHAEAKYDTISVPRAAEATEEGAPAIPQEGIFVALPNGAENVSVEVKNKTMKPIPGKLNLKPAPKQITEEEYIEGKEEYKPNKELYGTDDEYPGKDFDFLGVKEFDGITVAHLLVYLAQYKPKSGSLSVVLSMDIEISYDIPPQTDAIPKKRTMTPILDDMILDSENIQDEEWKNEDEVEESEENPFFANMEEGGFEEGGLSPLPLMLTHPTADVDAVLKNPNIISEYVIITTPTLQQAVLPLWHVKKGWPHYARVATTNTINAEFPASSLKESIKEFLRWAWDNWRVPPRYVVLAGDTDTIPVHMWKVGGTSYPSDHYYADIKGSLAPEIVVSRIPTSDVNKMYQVCKKLAKYAQYRGPDWGSWKNEVLLVAYQNSGYMSCSDTIATEISPRFKVTKRYGNSSTEQQVKDELNDGVLIANYRGHGSPTEWSSSNGIDTQDIGALTNINKPPVVFCVCCENAHIDNPNTETFVEKFIRDGKTVAILGASRPSYTYPNHDFNKYLFRAIMNHGEVTPGRVFRRAQTMMALNHSNSTSHKANVVMYMLFGDPTAKVVSTVEYLRGIWRMDHDGWKGTLTINRIWNHRVKKIGNCGYSVWSFSGHYTPAGTSKKLPVSGYTGGKDNMNLNPGCKESAHRVEYTIRFSSNHLQKFTGYVMTWTRNIMAGYTWWAKRPFAWYAKKV